MTNKERQANWQKRLKNESGHRLSVVLSPDAKFALDKIMAAKIHNDLPMYPTKKAAIEAALLFAGKQF